MGSLSYTSMKDRVLFQLGGPSRTELTTPTDYIGIWVNMALSDLTTKNRVMGLKKGFVFPQLEVKTDDTTVDGQAYVSVPTDALIIRHVFDTTNGKQLFRIRWHEYIAYTDRETAASEGKPTEWVRSADKIYLHSTPDSAYDLDIFYKKLHPALSLSTDVTEIGDEWDDVIVSLAVLKGTQWLKNWDEYKILKGEWLENVSAMLGIYDLEERDMHPNIKGSTSYNDYDYRG